MPSNTTQRRSGSGERPERDSSSGGPEPTEIDPGAAEVEAEAASESATPVAESATPTTEDAAPATSSTTPSAAGGDAAKPDTPSTPAKSTPAKSTPAKRTPAKRTPAKSAAAKTGAARTGAARTGAAKTGAAKTGAAKTGAAKTTSATKRTPTKAGTPAKTATPTKTGAAAKASTPTKASPAKASPAKATPAKAADAADAAVSATPAKATPAKAATAASTTAPAKAATKTAGAKQPARSGGGKGPTGRAPGGKGTAGKGPGGRGRQPVKVVKAGIPWGTVALGGIVAVVALSIIGYGIWYSWDAGKPFGERRSQQIDGLVNYRAQDVSWLTRNHVTGKVTYKTSPPVGGNHNASWEACDGQVYSQQIPNEHAVHALEHGAVWITYRPGLPQAQIDELARKVKGNDYMLMSPYPGLNKPISLQAWGLQLKVDNASDDRIDKFIGNFRQSASVEAGASCSNGVTVTGATPTEAATTDSSMGTGN